MVVLVAALVTGCGDGTQKFTVRIEPSPGTYAKGLNWDGFIDLYHSYDRSGDKTEVLNVRGNGSKTYEVRAKGVCVHVWATGQNDGPVTVYIDYNSSFGKITQSSWPRGFPEEAQVCAYSDSWPEN